MKKLLALLLAMIVVLSMVACGEDVSNDDDDDDDDDDEKTTQTEKADVSENVTGVVESNTSGVAESDTPESDTPVSDTPESDTPVSDTPVSDTPVDELAPAGFEIGSVENGIYTNAWANIKYAVPESMSDWTANAGADLDGENEACGIFVVDMTVGEMVAVLFEKIGYNADSPTTAKESVEQIAQDAFEGTVVSDVQQVTIAGKTFWQVTTSLTNDGTTMYDSVAAAEHDGYFIFIMASATSETTLDNLIGAFTVLN